MKRRIFVLLLGLTMILGIANLSSAAGFGIYEWSSRGNALGGALVARADDASALAFNPAGITQLDGVQLQAGVSVINPGAHVDAQNPYTGDWIGTDAENNYWLPPHLYATVQLSEKLYAGLGTYSRFGLGTEFEDDWAGRYFGYQSFVETFSVNPSVAVKLTDKLSVAVGVEAMYIDIDLRQVIDGTQIVYAQDPANAAATLTGLGLSPTVNDPSTNALDVDSKITGDNVSYGFNLALHYKIDDQWSAGVAYHSQVHHSIRGDIDLSPSPTAQAIFGNALFQDGGASGTIILPDILSMGVAYKPLDNLSFEVDAVWTRWSTYYELGFTFDELDAIGAPSTVSEKRWNDVWRFQFGVEYTPVDWLDLRLGYVYDQSPLEDDYEDYRLPTNDRQLFCGGVGFNYGDFTLDLSYIYLTMAERDVEARSDEYGFPEMYNSKYNEGDAHIYGVTLGYKF